MPIRVLMCALLMQAGGVMLHAQSCTTQSEMSAAERDGLKAAALTLAAKVQAADVAGVRALATAEMAAGDTLAEDVGEAAPHLKNADFTVESLWLFDAEDSGGGKSTSAGAAGLVDFYCALPGEADSTFALRVTGATKYAVAIVHATGIAAPWQMTLTLKQVGAAWRMSDAVAKPLTCAGHDGVWYWTAGRAAEKTNEKLTAWLYLLRADQLLTPMNSISSSNGDKLHGEIAALGMPEVSAAKPMVIDGGGEKYSITSIGTDDALGGLDVVVHVAATDVSDAVTARKFDLAVMHALLSAYPGLRGNFHGVWVFADAPAQAPFAIEQTMGQIE